MTNPIIAALLAEPNIHQTFLKGLDDRRNVKKLTGEAPTHWAGLDEAPEEPLTAEDHREHYLEMERDDDRFERDERF